MRAGARHTGTSGAASLTPVAPNANLHGRRHRIPSDGRNASATRRPTAGSKAVINRRSSQSSTPSRRVQQKTPQLSPKWRHRRSALSVAAVAAVIVGGLLAGAFLPAARIPRSSRSVAAAAGPADGKPSPVRLAVVAPLDEMSRFGVPWRQVLEHTATRLSWADPSFHLAVLDAAAAAGPPDAADALQSALASADIAVALHVRDGGIAVALWPLLNAVPTAVAVDSAPALHFVGRVAGRAVSVPPPTGGVARLLRKLQDFLGGSAAARGNEDRQALDLIHELYLRYSSDDLLYCFLVLINQAVRAVPAVANSTTGKNAGLGTLQCMVTKCGREIVGCVGNASCRTALGCLSSCRFNDQVCSYRCIASYESPQLEAFSLCILQKHSCLGLTADIPALPDPAPMPSFRGATLTHEMAEDLLIGWLKEPTSKVKRPEGQLEAYSWRAFAGKNPAYDYFPYQSQLFYRGRGRGQFWYQPVFKVITLDGREVWRQRLYRVRRGPVPGTFRFTVLDNGVTSNEYWRMLDCAEDLEWCAFYYSGAASAAGLSYTGAILTSRGGMWPQGEAARRRIAAALDRSGIKAWELANVRWEGEPGEMPLQPADLALV